MPRKKRAIEPKPGYGFSDVLALTNATRSNLIHWTNIHLIQPSIEDTTGPGYPRRFSALNVIQTELCVFLSHFRVPTEVMHGGMAAFNLFHRYAVALYEELEPKMPLQVDPLTALFRSEDERRRTAEGFIKSNFPYPKGEKLTLEEMQAGAEYAKDMARAWAEIRTGPLNRGIPDPANRKFLGLFIGATHYFAYVALDPKDVGQYVSDAAMVISLHAVVFSVGQRVQQSIGLRPGGLSLGSW